MNLTIAATCLNDQVGSARPAKEADRALLWIVLKHVPANSEDREIAMLALGRIEGIASALAGTK